MHRFAILGHPVSHSLSPALHNAVFEALGLNDHRYEYCDTAPEDLEGVLQALKIGEYDGFSVTIPYKQEVMKYCDELSDVAKRVGAVNTVVRAKGQNSLPAGRHGKGQKSEEMVLYGDNTDYMGFQKALEENDQLPMTNDQKALVLGAGGVSRAVIAVLLDMGYQVLVATRNVEKAQNNLGRDFDVSFSRYDDLDPDDDWGLIVNCTPVGMREIRSKGQGDLRSKGQNSKSQEAKNASICFSTEAEKSQLEENLLLKDKEWYQKDRIYVDVIYTPRITPFLQRALDVGAQIVTGDRMFLWQAVEQAKIFTGRNDVPVELMEEVLEQAFLKI